MIEIPFLNPRSLKIKKEDMSRIQRITFFCDKCNKSASSGNTYFFPDKWKHKTENGKIIHACPDCNKEHGWIEKGKNKA